YLSKLRDIATDAKLDGDLLAVWVAELLNAGKDPGDPLHPWAKVAADPGAKEPKRLAELLKPFVAEPEVNKYEVVIDCARSSPDEWLPDDVSFGDGPVRPGQVRVSGEPAKPVVQLADNAAAEFDPTWESLKAAPGTEGDPGALGGMSRAGRP